MHMTLTKARNIPFLRLLLFAFLILAVPSASHAQVRIGVSVRVGPPALPVYAQPMCPGPGYIWTPGYWANGDDGYYWVPGTWVMAPEPGLLWTPGYWGWGDSIYVWHRGYWGPHVGFYGGINYGFGYTGVGYAGGYWRGGAFFYNRSVNHINVEVFHNVYDRHVDDRFESRVSFNGGHDGIDARPSRQDEAFDHERHVDATREQEQHRDEASHDRAQFASFNHGHPDVAATPRPGAFNDRGATHANNRSEGFNNDANGNRNSFRNDNRAARQDNARPQRKQRYNKQRPAKPGRKSDKSDGRGDHRR